MSVELLLSVCDYTTIGAALVLKLPQVIKLLQTKNTRGISLNGLFVEYLAHLIVFSYNWLQKYPLQSYFEYALLISQDILLIIIILNTQGDLDLNRLAIVGLSIAIFTSLAQGYPNPTILHVLVNFVIPIGASSKIMYIRELWRTKDSSNVSLTTWVLATYSSMARVITNGVKGDIPLTLHSSTSATLCFVMCVCAVYFKSPSSAGSTDSKSSSTEQKLSQDDETEASDKKTK